LGDEKGPRSQSKDHTAMAAFEGKRSSDNYERTDPPAYGGSLPEEEEGGGDRLRPRMRIPLGGKIIKTCPLIE